MSSIAMPVAPRNEQVSAQGLHVLVVEASRELQRTIAEALEGWGHTVSFAAHAQDAQRELGLGSGNNGRPPVDVLVSSLEVPGGSGIDLTRMARWAWPTLGVVLFGAEAGLEVESRARLAGASAVLCLPLAVGALRWAVEAATWDTMVTGV